MAKQSYLLLMKGDECPVARYDVDTEKLEGSCHTPYSWKLNGDICEEHFFADCSFKPDSCTHWYFFGEDADSGADDDFDGYYHICGPEYLNTHISTMLFMWEVNRHVVSMRYPWTEGEYRDDKRVNKMIDDLLETHEILVADRGYGEAGEVGFVPYVRQLKGEGE